MRTQAWRLTNDLLVEPGGRPWISEMYGFSFGSAKAGVTYEWRRTAMIYPSDYSEGDLSDHSAAGPLSG